MNVYYMCLLYVSSICIYYMCLLNVFTICFQYMCLINVSTIFFHYLYLLHVFTLCVYYVFLSIAREGFEIMAETIIRESAQRHLIVPVSISAILRRKSSVRDSFQTVNFFYPNFFVQETFC